MLAQTTINKGMVYIPLKYRKRLNLNTGDKLLIKCNENGLIICKPTIIQQLNNDVEDILISLDEDMKRLWFRQKVKDFKNKLL